MNCEPSADLVPVLICRGLVGGAGLRKVGRGVGARGAGLANMLL